MIFEDEHGRKTKNLSYDIQFLSNSMLPTAIVIFLLLCFTMLNETNFKIIYTRKQARFVCKSGLEAKWRVRK